MISFKEAKQMSLDKWEEIIEKGYSDKGCGFCERHRDCESCALYQLWGGMFCVDDGTPFAAWADALDDCNNDDALAWAMVIYMDILDTEEGGA